MGIDAEVVISGGGLTGITLAVALAKFGMPVALVDPRKAASKKTPGFDGRAYALSQATARMFGALGLWKDMEPLAQPMLDIKVAEEPSGPRAGPVLHFDHADLEEGPMAYMIEDRHMRRLLESAARSDPKIKMLRPARIASIDISPGKATATLDSGDSAAAKMIAGCDGASGAVARMAGIRRLSSRYRQDALVCSIGHERPHEGCAFQIFMPSGPLAILPLPENRSSIVWTQTREMAQRLGSLEDGEFLDELKAALGGFFGDISLIGGRGRFPLRMSTAYSPVAERVALAGDSLREIHPLAGQGLNLGLRDVATLAEILVEARRRGEDIGSSLVLERYRRWRSFDTLALSFATDAVNRIFSNESPVLGAARSAAMGIVKSCPPLKRLMMRNAAGLHSSRPKLLCGHPI